MQTAVTVFFIVAAILCLLAALGLFAVAKIGAEALFLAGVFLAWAGLSRLP